MLFREKRQVVICVLAVMLIGGFVVFGYMPLRKKITSVETERIACRVETDMTLTQSDQLPLLKDRLEKLQNEVGDYDAQVPMKLNLGAFQQQISDLMKKHGLTEQLIEPGEELEADEVNCKPVSIQCKGRLEQVYNFFDSLESLDRLVRIEGVELTNDSKYSGQVSMQAKTIIFYRSGEIQG
jgi:Tfp pilus assembly protein PilO